MFQRQHPLCERLGRIVRAYRHGALRDDRTVVQHRGDEMHGTAVHANPGGQRLGVRVQAGKRGQQRRVDVNQSPGIAVDENRGQHPHEPRQYDEIRLMQVNLRGQRGIESVAAGMVAVMDDCRRNAVLVGPVQSSGVGTAGDDRGDIGGPTFLAAGTHDFNHIATPARNEKNQPAPAGRPGGAGRGRRRSVRLRQDAGFQKREEGEKEWGKDRGKSRGARSWRPGAKPARRRPGRQVQAAHGAILPAPGARHGVPVKQNCKLCAVKPSLHIFRSQPPPGARRPCALTIGNFDGVHRGHQAMLAQVRGAAAERGITPAVMTFEPHPREYFATLNQRPELAPARISGLRDKLDALARCGVELVVVERFNARLAEMSPEDFIDRLLVQGMDAQWLLVGPDFRFGHKRRGDIALLREAGRRHGFHVETLDDVTDAHGQRISSSEVRAALGVGDLTRARELLGHPYHLSGHVIHGRKLGRTLGYPTLNLRVAARCAARAGIYAVRVHGLQARPLAAVASLGVRPTVEDHGRVLLEAHVLDARVDAYGKLVRIEFLQMLRDEEKFPDLPSLTAAIAEDARNARAYFAVHGL